MSTAYTIELLGGLQARQGDQVIAHFRTQKTAVLLAYLASALQRRHAREELIALLWPEADLDSGRTSLRTALASLRKQLEPPGTPEGSILIADRLFVQLNPDAVSTDVHLLENHAKSARTLESPTDRAEALRQAVAYYKGPLLPGFYEDWVVRERERLQAFYLETLRDYVAALEAVGDFGQAVEMAHRVVALDPLIESAQCDLMRLYAKTGQYSALNRQYREMERVFRQELGTSPSAAAISLLDQLLKEKDQNTGGEIDRSRNASPAPKPILSDPEEAALPASAIPPKKARTHSLPQQMTRFIGREEELARLEALLQPGVTTLLTLTGPGGTGKTRLSLEVARRLADVYENAVWFVPLADLEEAERIPEFIAHVLQLPRTPEGDPMHQIVEHLSPSPSLLVLDNFEQLAEEGAAYVQPLLERTPNLTCLVTSRQRLDIGFERQFPLSPLPVPDLPGGPEQLLEFPSVRLFLDRAQAARPDFQITRENAVAVAALCDKLEGLPLALELAAAWAQTLTPAQMLTRLERRFELLTSRRRDLAPRHRTLWNAVEWSYHLLEPPLQRFFNRLSVFRGGWTIAAAEAVCDEPMGLDFIQQLRDRSLIVADEYDDGMRYRFLETLREYASAQLSEEEREKAAEAHLRYFAEFATTVRPLLDGPEQTQWLERLEREHENFRAALEWARSEPDRAEVGLGMAGQLHFFWYVRGYYPEGLHWLTEMLNLTAVRSSESDASKESLHHRAQGLQGAAELASTLGDRVKAQGLIEASLKLWREIEYLPGVGYSLNYLGIIKEALGERAQAQAYYEESLALWQRIGDKGGTAHALKCLGAMWLTTGDFKKAQLLYDEAMSLYQESGNRRGILMMVGERARFALMKSDFEKATLVLHEYLEMSRDLKDLAHTSSALFGLGQVAYNKGDYPRARVYYEETLEIVRELGQRHGIIAVRNYLGGIAVEQSDYAAAAEWFEQGLILAREIGDRHSLASLLDSSGLVYCHRGDFDRARASLLESLQVYRELEDRWGISRVLRHLGNVANDGNNLDAAEQYYRDSLAMTREIEDRHGIGMALYDLGTIARQRGDLAGAHDFWTESQSYDQALGVKGGSVLGALGTLAAERGDFEEARRLWSESLSERWEIGNRKGIAECLDGLAAVNLAQSLAEKKGAEDAAPLPQLLQAARLMSVAESLRKALGSPLPLNLLEDHQRRLAELRESLGPALFSSVWAEGQSMPMEEAIEAARQG